MLSQTIGHITFGFGRVFHALLRAFQSSLTNCDRTVTFYTHFPSSLIITEKQLSFIPFLLINPIKQFLRPSKHMTACSQSTNFCGFMDMRPKQNLQAGLSRLSHLQQLIINS